MPRRRDPLSPQMVHRTARAGLRATRGQRRRLIGLLISAGDVWTAVLELNGRVAGVDPGIIHPYAVAGPGGEGLLVSGGRSAPSTGCTWPTPRPAGRRSPAALGSVALEDDLHGNRS
jgi:hypothetical protein